MKYLLGSLWYDSTLDWTPVSQTIGEILLIKKSGLLRAEGKYRIIFITLSDLFNFFKKTSDKSKFTWVALLLKHFTIKIQSNMSEQEKKRQRINNLLNIKTEQI